MIRGHLDKMIQIDCDQLRVARVVQSALFVASKKFIRFPKFLHQWMIGIEYQLPLNCHANNVVTHGLLLLSCDIDHQRQRIGQRQQLRMRFLNPSLRNATRRKGKIDVRSKNEISD